LIAHLAGRLRWCLPGVAARSALLAATAFAVACGGAEPPPQVTGVEPHPADAFLARIAGHCGEAYAGAVISDVPATANDPFTGRALVMHLRECSAGEIRIPFHVGDDHSRTWVLTRTDTGLRLKHDHRHEDGSPDAVTMYGGDTTTPGSLVRQEFPVDAESIKMFEREGLAAAVTNVWAMEIEPGKRFLYELSRPGGRRFQVEFDLTTPVPPPPPPWGSQDPE
jgi:hypothetical protein